MEYKKIWQLLGIEPTEDENEIRNAYRTKLPEYNPEDDPEGFKALREAFEEAVRLMREKPKETELSPVELLINEAKEIYNDIPRRRNVGEWEKWADNPLVLGLDTVDTVREQLLVLMMECFQLPREVWMFLDRIFSIKDEAETLIEKFPENYIRFVISHIDEDNYFTFDAIIKREDFDYKELFDISIESDYNYEDESEISDDDKYISNVSSLYNCYNAVSNRYTPEEDIPKIIDELGGRILSLRKSDIYHPFEMIGVIKFLEYKGRYEEMLTICERFLTDENVQIYDNFTLANLAYGYVICVRELGLSPDSIPDAVKAALDKVLDKEHHYVIANYARSIYYFLKGDYVKSDEDLLLAAEFADQNTDIEKFIEVVDGRLIQYYEKLIEEEPEIIKNYIELGWCYLRQENAEKARELLRKVEPDEENRYSYYNLMGRCYIRDENYKEAYPYILEWQKYLVELYERYEKDPQQELSEQDSKRLERVGYSYYLLSLCYKDMGDQEAALKNMDYAMTRAVRDDEKFRYRFVKGQLLHEFNRYEEAMDLWNGFIEDNHEYIPAYILRQEAAYNLRNAQQVLNDFWTIVSAMPDYTRSYIYAAKVYNAYERYDLFDEMLGEAEKNEIKSMGLDAEIAKRYRQEGKYKESCDIYDRLYEGIDEENCDIEDKLEFTIEYGVSVYNLARTAEEGNVKQKLLDKCLMLAEKAIEMDNKSRRAHWLKTDVLEIGNIPADEEYKKMLEIFPEDPDVFYEYGLYLERMDRDDEAIAYHKKTVEIFPGHRAAHGKLADYYLDVYRDSEDKADYEKAVQHSIRQNENYESAYNYVAQALIYIEGNEFEKAVIAADNASKESPGDVYACNAKAYALMMLKRMDEAEEAFKTGLEILKEEPYRTALQRNYIKFLEMNRRYEEAIKFSIEFYGMFEIDDSDSHIRLGSLYRKAGKYLMALKEYCVVRDKYIERATGVKPDREYIGVFDVRSHFKKSNIEGLSYIVSNQIRIMELLFTMGRKDDYKKVYNDLAKFIKKENFPAKYRFVNTADEETKIHAGYAASIIRDMGRHEIFVRRDYSEAIKCFEISVKLKAIEDAKSLYKIHMYGKNMLELAEAYMRAGRTAEARDMAEKALIPLINPNETIEGYLEYPNERPYRLGEIAKYYFYTGNKEKAYEYLEMMPEFPFCSFCRNPECYDRLLTKGNFLEIEGDKDAALKCYILAMEMCDDDTELDAAVRELQRDEDKR